MGLTPSVCTVLCFMLSACNSTDEPIEEALSNANPEMIHFSNGDALLTSLDKTIDNKINLRL